MQPERWWIKGGKEVSFERQYYLSEEFKRKEALKLSELVYEDWEAFITECHVCGCE